VALSGTFQTSSVLFTLNVPMGVEVQAKFRANIFNLSGITFGLFTSPDETIAAANTPSGNLDAASPVTSQANSNELFIWQARSVGSFPPETNVSYVTIFVW
jgi:hypothetical protein